MPIDKSLLQTMPFGKVPPGTLFEAEGKWHRLVKLPPKGNLPEICIGYELEDQEHPETSMAGTRRGLVYLEPDQAVHVFLPTDI